MESVVLYEVNFWIEINVKILFNKSYRKIYEYFEFC